MVLAVLVLTAGIVLLPSASPVSAAVPTIPLADVSSTHPKLLLNQAGFDSLRSRIATESTLNSWYPSLVYRADKMLNEPVSTYKVVAGRLLVTSEVVLDRAYTLGIMWKLSGDAKYANRLWSELNAVTQFPDWNPSHYLDVAAMANAVAIGYDWIYSELTPANRTQIVNAVNSKAFSPTLSQFSSNASWVTQPNNWNLISNSGIGIAALAFSSELPTPTASILNQVRSSLVNGLSIYGPDGGFNEGISYWQYATNYLVSFVSALESSTGKTYGLLDSPGLSKTGAFAVAMTGASRSTFDYGDAVGEEPLTTPLLGLAALFDDESLLPRAVTGSDGIYRDEVSARGMIWYEAASASARTAASQKPLDQSFSGVGVATLRSSWNDPLGVSAMLRASSLESISHANLDAGDFSLDASGVNWAVETGTLNGYDQPGYLDSTPTGGRWNYYRNRPEGQNTLVVDPSLSAGARTTTSATVSIVKSDPSTGAAVADLTSVYAGVSSWKRGLAVTDSRQRVVVQDEITLAQASDVWWFMHTKADVAVAADGRSAVLTQGGKQLLARITSASGPTFVYMAAAPLPTSPSPAGQILAADIGKLAIKLEGITTATLTVEFVPLGPSAAPAPAAVVALSSWGSETPAPARLSGLTVDGVPVANFAPATLNYHRGASTANPVPTVTAVGEAGATVAVVQASTVPGVATVTVSRAGYATSTYRVHLDGAAIPPVSLTATANGGSVGSLVDGDILSQWNVTGDHSVVLDYGRSVSVQRAQMFWPAVPALGSYFEIYGSNDNTNWVSLVVSNSWISNQTRTVTFPTPNAAYRYLKLVVHGDRNADKRTVLSEFQVFGPEPAGSTAATAHASITASLPSGLVSNNSAQLTYVAWNAAGVQVSPAPSSMSFASSDPNVASVSSTGMVTGGVGGQARISVSTLIGRDWVTATRVVTITDPLAQTIPVSADTFVIGGGSSALNFNSQNHMQILSKPVYAAYEQMAYLKFSLAGLSSGDIESAQLVFNSWVSQSESALALTAYATSSTWSEATMTFNSKPSMNYRVGTTTIDPIDSERRMDITDYVKLQAGQDVSIGLRQDDPVGGFGPQVYVWGGTSAKAASIQLRLRDGSTATVAPPTLTTAYANAQNEGRIIGQASGPANTTVSVSLALSTRSSCAPVMFDAAYLATVPVALGSNGLGSFDVPATIPKSASVIAQTWFSRERSLPSACLEVGADPTAIERVVVPVARDTYVQGGWAATNNYGSSTTLQVMSKPAYPDYEQSTFLGFSLAGVDASRIQSATLFLNAYTAAGSNATATLSAYATSGTWTETGMVFGTRLPETNKLGTSQSFGMASTQVSMSVTDFARQSAGSVVTVSLRQADPAGGVGPQIYVKSRESTTAPYLELILNPVGTQLIAAPEIATAYTNSTNAGTVSGTVVGPPSTQLTLELGVISGSACVPVLASARSFGSQQVTTDSAGRAAFEVTGQLAVGDKVIGVTIDDQRRSAVSACVTVVHDPTATERVVVPVERDAYVQGGWAASNNYGSATVLQVLSKPAYPEFEQTSYLGFSLAGIDPARIQSATLVMNAYTASGSNATATLSAYATTGTWTETDIVFGTRLPETNKLGTSQSFGMTSTQLSMSLTDFARQSAGSAVTVSLRQADPTDGVGPQIYVRSRESTAAPYLELILTPVGTQTQAGPTIASAFSNAASEAEVTGSVTGPPSTEVTVEIASLPASLCVPVLASGRPFATQVVTTDADGYATFSVTGTAAVGEKLVAVTTFDGGRSAVSSCADVLQDPVQPIHVLIPITADAYVAGGGATSNNFGSLTYLQVLSKPAYATFEQRTFMSAALGAIDPATIQSAKLVLSSVVQDPAVPSVELSVYSAGSDWTESTVTFANQPPMQVKVGTTTVTTTESSLEVDLTAYLQSLSGPSVSLGIRQDDPVGGIGPSILIRSRESAKPAYLDIWYLPAS
jgi:hypothetical protein